MAVIKSGASSSTLTVDPTSNAAHVTIYDTAGTPVNPGYSIYGAPINVAPTTLTSGTVYWTMRNTGAKNVYLRALSLCMAGWSGVSSNTAGSATGGNGQRAQWEFIRFSGATPTGGTALTVIKRRNADPASVVGDLRQTNAVLTTTGATFEANAFLVVGVTVAGIPAAQTAGLTVPGAASASNIVQEVDFSSGGEEGRIQLAAGEGMAIRANTAIPSANYALTGMVWWDER